MLLNVKMRFYALIFEISLTNIIIIIIFLQVTDWFDSVTLWPIYCKGLPDGLSKIKQFKNQEIILQYS
jgi:hypothetical protein